MEDENSLLREKKYREYSLKKAAVVKIVVFLAAIVLVAVVSLIMPLRQSYSEKEKRELTAFPTMEVEAFMDGDYFSQIDKWFADTFPFRDVLISCGDAVDKLYGIRNQVIHGTIVAGDEIPDVGDEFDGDMVISMQESTLVASDTVSSNIETLYGYDELDKDIDVSDIGTTIESNDSSMEAMEGESLGSIFVVGDRAYNYYSFSQKYSDRYIALVNNMADMLKGKAKVYSMIVPTSIDIALEDATRNSLNSSNQKKAILYMYSRMGKDVGKCYVYDVLRQHRDDYIYYRTDHHWTSLGAYYAYNVFMWQEGKEAKPLDWFECCDYGEFKGSFYSQTGIAQLGNNPDRVTVYKPKGTNKMEMTNKSGQVIDYNVITDVSGWNPTSKYSTFIGGDNPISHINNPNISDGSSILVIKESYGNAFVPYLVDNYQDIYVIDYRYFGGTVSELVDTYGIDTVLLLNNIAATSTDLRVAEMTKICR